VCLEIAPDLFLLYREKTFVINRQLVPLAVPMKNLILGVPLV
jgi:hypothetical protein